MRALLSEDNQGMRLIIRNLLKPMTTRFVEALTLADTLKICREEDFDIALIDLCLLDATPDETIAAIPKIVELSKAPVIVITGNLEPGIKLRCKEAGAVAFVQKSETMSVKLSALVLAVKAAVLRNPDTKGKDLLDHVALLERLVAI